MKEKDKNMGSQLCEDEKSNLPPVRGGVQKSSKRPLGPDSGLNQRGDKSNKDGHSKKSAASSHTHDYFRDKWDKFDVDAALRDVDEREEVAPPRKDAAVKIKTASKSANLQSSLQRNIGDGNMRGYLGNSRAVDRLTSVFKANDGAPDAMLEKEQGNEYFKEKKYAEAIDSYSRSIVLQPTAVAFANRAMAYIKMRRFEEAEYDCSEAIDLDDRYVKAYSRRGTAKKELGKLLDAIDDFEFALRLEPENKELSKKIKFEECVAAIVTSTNYKDFQIFSQKSTATGGWSTEKGGVKGVESDHRNRGIAFRFMATNDKDWFGCLDSYFGTEVSEIKDTIDEGSKNILKDLISFLLAYKSSSRVEELAPYLQEQCFDCISTLIVQVEEHLSSLSATLVKEMKLERTPQTNNNKTLQPPVIVERAVFVGNLLVALSFLQQH